MVLNKIVGIDMNGGNPVDGEVSVNRLASGVVDFLENSHGTNVVLYGCSEKIVNAFGKREVPAGVEIVPSVAGDRRRISLRNLVADVNSGKIGGIYTNGDTSELGKATSRMRVKKLGSKPTIITVFPSLNGEFVFSDGGFTTAHSDEVLYVDAVDTWAREIYKQGLMASVYAESICDGKLRWGILSNGTEKHKGSDVDKRLDELINEGINKKGLGGFVDYIGKVEAKDCYTGRVDVALVGGYMGNFGLKMAEGSLWYLKEEVKRLKEGLTLWQRAKLVSGKGVLAEMTNDLMAKIGMDARSHALVLGYRAPVVKGHGTASRKDIYYGIRRLADCDDRVSGEKILARVGKYFLDSK